MSKTYSGVATDYQDADVQTHDVSRVVISKKKITIEWSEAGETGYLEATSVDGITYHGYFGYPRPEPGYIVENLRPYTAANGSVLFLSRWRWSSGPNGVWLFRLEPTQD